MMSDISQITTTASSLGLNSKNEAYFKDLLSNFKDKPEQLNLIHSILKAEESNSYFDKDHFKNALPQKKLLDLEFTDICSKIIGCIYESKTFNTQSSYLNKLGEEKNMEAAFESLKSNGYYILPTKLSDSILDSIKAQLKSTPLYMRNRINNLPGFDENELQKIKSNVAWLNDQQDLNRIPEFQNIIFDPNILNLAGRYLGSIPIHVQSNFWVSKKFDTSRRALSANAQLFHQDKEFIKFLKVFIYLDDVDKTNGAHVYIKGSHTNNKFKTKKGYKVSDRIDDDEIASIFGAENIITMEGKKGTIIIEDTSGFHKGTPILKGHRTMLQIEYANSLYFNPVGSFSYDGLQEKYLNLLKDTPRIGLNYDNNRYKNYRAAFNRNRKIKSFKGYIKDTIKRYL